MCGPQDEGKQDKTKPHIVKYGALDKLAKHIANRLARHSPPGMPGNATGQKQDVMKILILSCKHVNKTNSCCLELVSIVQDPKNKLPSPSEPDKLFVVTNDITNAGFNVAMSALPVAWSQWSIGMNLSCTTNDPLQVAYIMLDSELCNSICGMLCSHKGDWNKQNQPISTVQHVYERCIKMFSDPNYVAKVPAEADMLDNYEVMNPNDPNRIAIQCDWVWFKSTWEAYLRKKYCDVLKCWNKQAGGGDATN